MAMLHVFCVTIDKKRLTKVQTFVLTNISTPPAVKVLLLQQSFISLQGMFCFLYSRMDGGYNSNNSDRNILFFTVINARCKVIK